MRCAVLAVALLSRPAVAEPALWAVQGKHATVYLLGSVHALPPGLRWEGPAIRRAVAAAQEFWFELDMSTADWAGAFGVLLSKGVDLRHRITDALSPAAAARFRDVVGDQLWWADHLRPWAATDLTAVWLERATVVPGVDQQLQRQAAAGKPIHGIETGASQLDLTADRPDRDATAELEAMLTAPAGSVDRVFEQTVRRWLAGGSVALGGPATPLSRRLIDDRNIVFADTVARLSRGDGTAMVVVGAAHMAGRQGVPAVLRRRGFRVRRVG